MVRAPVPVSVPAMSAWPVVTDRPAPVAVTVPARLTVPAPVIDAPPSVMSEMLSVTPDAAVNTPEEVPPPFWMVRSWVALTVPSLSRSTPLEKVRLPAVPAVVMVPVLWTVPVLSPLM